MVISRAVGEDFDIVNKEIFNGRFKNNLEFITFFTRGGIF